MILDDSRQQTPKDSRHHWSDFPGKQRVWESHLNNASWFPVERWLDLPLCEEFQYVVTLREPVPRLLHQCLGQKQLGRNEVMVVMECDVCIYMILYDTMCVNVIYLIYLII